VARTKVLIVDDDPDIVFIMRAFLNREGLDVVDAADGLEGMKKILEESPDVVVLDVMMPGMDGYQVCERIKRGESDSDLPIIFLSAKTGQADIDRGYAAGADDYLTKPFQPMDLLESIGRLTLPAIGVERRWRSANPVAITDMDVRRFVHDHLQSLAQWTILEHFTKTDPPVMTALQVASWYSSAPRGQVEQELNALVDTGVLEFEVASAEYRLTENRQLVAAMNKFFEYCKNMDARLRVICMILEREH
jgi:DNA-binding response OmpR family regulator